MKKKAEARAEQRRRELAAIHIGKQELGWDDVMYRDMLEAWTGKRSAGKMNQDERHRVLDNMRKAGFEKQDDDKTPEQRVQVQEGDKPQVKKIKNLWLQLHRAGAVEDPSPRALNAFVKRMTDIASVNWCPAHESNTVIEALKSWLDRAQ